MKNIFNGFCTAFSMYSILPVPQVKWNDSTMKYAMCFFPLVGAVIGAFLFCLHALMKYFAVNVLLYSGVLTAIPVLISGGIHLDGFIDTCDAKFSRQSLERKLEILKDPHIGAFGAISCCCYFLLYFSVCGQLYNNNEYILILCLGFLLSRTWSGLSVVTFPLAKNTGLVYLFAERADKKTVRIVFVFILAAVIIAMLLIHVLIGAAAVLITAVWFLIYKRMCKKEFGGITGDLAGFFLVIAEFLILLVAVIGGCLC